MFPLSHYSFSLNHYSDIFQLISFACFLKFIEINHIYSFVSGFFSQILSERFNYIIGCSYNLFSSLYSILPYDYATIHLSTLVFIDIWVDSRVYLMNILVHVFATHMDFFGTHMGICNKKWTC